MGDKQYGSVTLNILSLVFNFHKKTAKNTFHFVNILCTMFAPPIYDSDINYTSVLQKRILLNKYNAKNEGFVFILHNSGA